MFTSKRVIAINLPQFHPFKENDEWWGKGFTEWRNVVQGRPLFKSHYQPHIPADLGFYDLRLPEARQAQADLAMEYGIYGFCYYHYWFNGHLLMEKPINEILKTKEPCFPFMLCWANENWTRAWNGRDRDVLIKQEYSEYDDIQHINYLLDNVFCDERYIKIDGKPVFAVYRSDNFPNIKRTIEIWRREAKKRNIELYLCRFESFGVIIEDLRDLGFDSAVEFPPHNIVKRKLMFQRSVNFIFRKLTGSNIMPRMYKYKWYVEERLKKEKPNHKVYPCITPCWDNTARKRRNAFVLTGSTPELYKKLFKNVYDDFEPYSEEENLFFINAWNEWAEGNHLEPDLKWGRKYLEATKQVIKGESV